MGKFGDYPDEWDKTDSGSFGGAHYIKQHVKEQRREKQDNRPPWRVPETSSGNGEHISPESSTDFDRICGEVQQQIRAITESVRKEAEMITGGNSPDAKARSGKKAGGFDYINTTDLDTDPVSARILAVKQTEGQYGKKVVLKLAYKGDTKLMSFSLKKNSNGEFSPNVKFFINQFGQEENDWIGKDITLCREQDEFTGQFWPKVGLPAKGRGK